MADDKDDATRRKELAEAFADGLDIFESRKAEREAKEAAANPPKEEKDDDAGSGKPSVAERFLGIF